jgi:hypothetical protein
MRNTPLFIDSCTVVKNIYNDVYAVAASNINKNVSTEGVIRPDDEVGPLIKSHQDRSKPTVRYGQDTKQTLLRKERKALRSIQLLYIY